MQTVEFRLTILIPSILFVCIVAFNAGHKFPEGKKSDDDAQKIKTNPESSFVDCIIVIDSLSSSFMDIFADHVVDGGNFTSSFELLEVEQRKHYVQKNRAPNSRSRICYRAEKFEVFRTSCR